MNDKIVPLREQCSLLKKVNAERKDFLKDLFVPQFIRYIGAFEDYPDIIATLKKQSKSEKWKWLFFENDIPFYNDFDMIETVRKTVERNNYNISSSDFVLFEDRELNDLFIECLNYTLDLAFENEKERFKVESIKMNFTVSLILNCYKYLRDMKFDIISNCKCIYYGELSKNNSYFLILLYRMMFDVIYINPVNEDPFDETDADNLSQKEVSKVRGEKWTIEELERRGKEILEVKGVAKTVENGIHKALYDGYSIFKEWQFTEGYTKPVFLNGVVADLYGSYEAEAKSRDGFETEDDVVKVPHFFMEIEGVYDDLKEYKKLVKSIGNSTYCAGFVNNFLNGFENIEDFFHSLDDYPLYFSQVVYTRSRSGVFFNDKLWELPFLPFRNIHENTGMFIFDKLNDVLERNDILNFEISEEEKIKFVLSILFMDPKIIRQIENFDFTRGVPKIAMFIRSGYSIDKYTAFMLAFLNEVGFDIIIFSPDGKSGVANLINKKFFNNIRIGYYASLELEEILKEPEKPKLISVKSLPKININIFNIFKKKGKRNE